MHSERADVGPILGHFAYISRELTDVEFAALAQQTKSLVFGDDEACGWDVKYLTTSLNLRIATCQRALADITARGKFVPDNDIRVVASL
jgi:hypothetical protein